ncbi:MAG: hypothetical protein HY902_13300 [Deltaproteobacteria bacterium]|nr:hypothetical protein [Deltaproteobacteria bacterium]
MRALTILALCAALAAGCSDTTSTGTTADAGSGDASSDVSFGAGQDSAGDAGDGSATGDSDSTSVADAASDSGGGADASPSDAKGGFNYECKPLTIESCVTACGSAGLRKCLKEWGPCFPPDEFCGNCVDDNCDGLVNEGCPPNPACAPTSQPCPVAKIQVAEGGSVNAGTTLHLTAAGSFGQGKATVTKWLWSVQTPAGGAGSFAPNATSANVTFLADVAGQYLFQLQVWDDSGVVSCVAAVASVSAAVYPPQKAEIGCADGTREGFLDEAAWPQIAGCAGAWEKPGITPDSVAPTCNHQGGNSGSKADGSGCAAPDLCSAGWHICKTWQEVAQKSPTGCAGATPADAKPKSLFFAIRQPSFNGSVCGNWGDGFNDVFGCGNLGTALQADKKCGPLDRVMASTKPNSCGFNEAEPNLGPWQCLGSGASDLNEGANVTKKACQNQSCQYDGAPIGPADKGGVLCCHD